MQKPSAQTAVRTPRTDARPPVPQSDRQNRPAMPAPQGRIPILTILTVILCISLAVLLVILAAVNYKNVRSDRELKAEEAKNAELLAALAAATASDPLARIEEPQIAFAAYTDKTKTITDCTSEYAILIDADTQTVVAEKNGESRIYPASMTKIMTLIVAAEHITDYTECCTMDFDIVNEAYLAGASIAGFSASEQVPLIDLMYGAALPSGADATAALARYIAGSEEAFADMMNAKAQSMGLRSTHFVNASGLHDPDHYSTPHEIALIMEYAMQSPRLAEILSTYMYTTTPTKEHPEGLLLVSTMFKKMRGDESGVAEVIAGKTGYTQEAHNCLASMAETPEGHRYVLVTAAALGEYAPIFDAIGIYKTYIPIAEKYK